MFIITDNEDVIIRKSTSVDYEENGNVLVDDGTGIASILVKKVYEVETIPEEIEEAKYCYTEEKGFYKNENYIEPPKPLEEQITDLEIAIAELGDLIVGGNE